MPLIDRIQGTIHNLGATAESLAKILLWSRRPSPADLKEDEKRDLVIIANGPSLNRTVAEHRSFLKDKALMAVNFCAVSPMFTDLRPEMYIIADPLFWIVPDKCESLFGALGAKTSWPMRLFMPVKAKGKANWQKLIAGNPNIRVVWYNTTPIEGFRWFTDMVYSKGIGMPRPHNVLIPAIATALRMQFRTIYLAGADHSWLPEIRVTEDNEVLMHQKHFYDAGSSKADTVKREDLSEARLHIILYHMHVAFKAYHILEDYARRHNKRIVNITPGSYIDAFERYHIPDEGRDGIVIQARTGSTRLPAKILKPFAPDGSTILDIIIEKAKRSCPDAVIVLATTDRPADDVLVEVAKRHGIECFRGSEQDVLSRFIGAAERFGLGRIIRVCSDNPFLDTDSFNTLFDVQSRTGADYVGFGFPDGRPTIKSHLGLFAELARTAALRRLNEKSHDKMDHEHVTIGLYTRPDDYRISLIPLPDHLKDRTDIRLTLDTPSDFELLHELYERHRKEEEPSTRSLIELVDSDPRYGSIMKQNIAQNEK